MYNKTMLLQLFAEEPPVEPTETVEEVVETEPTEEVDNTEPSEPIVYRDLDYKYKDETGKLGDVAPEEVIKNFQLGKKYLEHEGDIALTKRLKQMYGVSSVEDINKMLDEAIENNIRESAPEGIDDEQMDAWVQFQKQQQEEQAKAPEKQREANMLKHVEQLKATGKIKSVEDIPDKVFEIYNKRGSGDLEGAYDSYQLEQTKTKLKESENAASSPGSLKGQAVIPKTKPVSQMSKSEYEDYKEQRRAIAAQANGG